MKQTILFATISIFLIVGIVLGDDAPKSKKALDAIAKHDAAVAKAAQAYWKACAAADKALADDLTAAENQAKHQNDTVEAKAIASVVDDVNLRRNDEATVGNEKPAAPPRLLAYEKPSTPEDAAAKAGKIVKGMTETQAFEAASTRAKSRGWDCRRGQTTTKSDGTRIVNLVLEGNTIVYSTITLSVDAAGKVVDFLEQTSNGP
jgi:hypothetical protein